MSDNKRMGLHLDLPVIFGGVSLEFVHVIDYETWRVLGLALAQVRRVTPFWIGDFLEEGERRWGESYAQAEELFNTDVEILRNYKWVSSRVPASLRNDRLRWSHHLEIAKLEPNDQKKWLDKAADNHWTVRELRAELEHVGKRKTVRAENSPSVAEHALKVAAQHLDTTPQELIDSVTAAKFAKEQPDECAVCGDETHVPRHVCGHCFDEMVEHHQIKLGQKRAQA